jgi:hypothetical protein
VYHRASLERKPLFIEDLAAYPDRTAVEQNLLDNGVRSLVVSPLHYQDATIGTLVLTSPRPGDLNSMQAPRIQEVLPLFSMAVKRSADELDMRVQAFIKEKCTAIHPVVEWRFRKAVFDGLERTVTNATAPSSEMEPIVFSDVYPLYAIADIRGSSTQRSSAIQADLLAQLALARDVLRAAHDARRQCTSRNRCQRDREDTDSRRVSAHKSSHRLASVMSRKTYPRSERNVRR